MLRLVSACLSSQNEVEALKYAEMAEMKAGEFTLNQGKVFGSMQNLELFKADSVFLAFCRKISDNTFYSALSWILESFGQHKWCVFGFGKGKRG